MKGHSVCLSAFQAMMLLSGALALAGPVTIEAQVAHISGYVTDVVGLPVKNGTVKLSSDRKPLIKDDTFKYFFFTDENGGYRGAVAPGTYDFVVFHNNKYADRIVGVVLKADDVSTVDIDMSRQEYLDALSDEQKKELQDYKSKSALEIEKAKITSLNSLLVQARADNKAGDYVWAIAAMEHATKIKPDSALLWFALGDGQMSEGEHLIHSSNPGIAADSVPFAAIAFRSAISSYKKAIDLNAASQSPNIQVTAMAYGQMGRAMAENGDLQGASAEFEEAAKAQPANAGTQYFNEAAIFYNVYTLSVFVSEEGPKVNFAAATAAVVAADKSIAADPAHAPSYYVKAKALAVKLGEGSGKQTAPPGLIQACNKYLALAPTGPYADEMKEMLKKRSQPGAPRVTK